MINSRLSVYAPAPFFEWVDVALTEDIPVSTNYSIADVRDISKKNTAFSKTIKILGTKKVNVLFETIFEINIDLSYFNPNLKTKCEYFVGTESNFKGFLQILNIIKEYEGDTIQVIYECAIIGEGDDLFKAIGERYLTDLDFAAYNHLMTNAVLTTYPAVNGVGIAYPFIDYGITGGNTNTWTVKHLKPAIFALDYINKIFAQAGKTFTSNHLNSAYFKSLIIPCVTDGALKKNPALFALTQFFAGKNAITAANIVGTNLGVLWIFSNNQNLILSNPVPFEVDSPLPFFDTGGIYNTGTYLWSTNYTGNYNVTVRLDCDIIINAPSGVGVPATSSIVILNGSYGFSVDIMNGGTVIGTAFMSVAPVNAGILTTFGTVLNIPSIFLTAGLSINVRFKKSDASNFRTIFFDAGASPITTGTSSIDVRILNTSTFGELLSTQEIEYNDQVVINETIPRNVKQRDFMSSIVKMENLYIEPDKNNPDNFIIEPRETFIDYANPLDWTKKLDISKPMEVSPMGDLDFKELIFTYKTDGDEFNVAYNKSYQETYGTKRVITQNEFIKTVKTTEVIFAASPMVGNNFNDIICTKLYKNDSGVVKTMAGIIRILIFRKQIPCTSFNLSGSGGITPNVTLYNYAGTMDDPYLPTQTIDWSTTLKLYYQYPNQSQSTNNLYNRGYSKLIIEITDKNSKIVKAWINLNSVDIRTFSFRKTVFIDGTYYFVNNIMNYNPNTRQSTQVELLKLKKGVTFVPAVIAFDNGDPAGFVAGNANPLPNQNLIAGENNVNFGENVIVIGENNYIGGGS